MRPRHQWLRGWMLGLGLGWVASALPAAGAPTHTADGFAIPQPGRAFVFPRDHGPHREFKIEWWYVTGHLATAEATPRRFGFQATFFRQAAPDRASEIQLAHMALTDLQTGRFLQQERLNRSGLDASIANEGVDLRQGPWRLHLAAADPARWVVQGGIAADARFELELSPRKPPVIFGEAGVSRKGADAAAASHYITFTRLAVSGRLWLNGGADVNVSGEAWMDHEFSSSQLSTGQVGWDWLSVQLHDGREWMLYQLRLRDGTADPASTLTWIDQGGATLKRPFQWKVVSRWKSRQTGAEYPATVEISTEDPKTGAPAVFRIVPKVADQEWPGAVAGIPYWEGACEVLDGGGRVVGAAFMELTGYARELKL